MIERPMFTAFPVGHEDPNSSTATEQKGLTGAFRTLPRRILLQIKLHSQNSWQQLNAYLIKSLNSKELRQIHTSGSVLHLKNLTNLVGKMCQRYFRV